MPRYGPVSRRKLIAAFRRAGWSGPVARGNHEAMVRDQFSLVIPNPHGSDIGIGLLKIILAEAGISRAEWERL